MRAKLGLTDERPGDAELIDDLLAGMHGRRLDYTSHLRSLSSLVGLTDPPDGTPDDAWTERWLQRLRDESRDSSTIASSMNRVNPIYIPRNHLVEEALAAATDGDMQRFDDLLAVITRPYDERAGLERYAGPAPDSFAGCYRTFCGT
jgi:uncharacterized protein YdiU (UPF0061 family)